MELFSFLNILFENPEEWDKISNIEKKKQFFMTTRRLAIQFPMQANALQHLKINPVAVVNYWQYFIRKKYNNLPGWMYTKGVKKTQEIKEKISVSKSLIDEYARLNRLDRKSVEDALVFYPDETKKILKDFEKIINQK
ncbi:MAG: hypothetical protein WC554_09700 [Clostridia bacterium]